MIEFAFFHALNAKSLNTGGGCQGWVCKRVPRPASFSIHRLIYKGRMYEYHAFSNGIDAIVFGGS